MNNREHHSTAITATVSVIALSFINDQPARPGRLLEWLMRNDRAYSEIILVLHCCCEFWNLGKFDDLITAHLETSFMQLLYSVAWYDSYIWRMFQWNTGTV